MYDKMINVEYGFCPFQGKKRIKILSDELDRESASSSTLLDTIGTDNGYLYFGDHGVDTKHKPFMATSCTSSMENVAKLIKKWRVSVPKLILFLVADVERKTEDTLKEYCELRHLLIEGLISTLNITETWICTNGVNEGFSSEFGVAYNNDLSRQKILRHSLKNVSPSFPETALMGICDLEDLKISEILKPLKVSNGEDKNLSTKKDIDEYFDYFIFLTDVYQKKQGISTFLLNFANYFRKFTCLEQNTESQELNGHEVPVIEILIHGQHGDIDVVLKHVNNGFPLIIIEGSGGLADLIAFAYLQIIRLPSAVNFAEYNEIVLKPLLSEKFNKLFPNLPQIKIPEKDVVLKVIDCIQHSTQPDKKLITLLSRYEMEEDSFNLTSNILKAIFKSKSSYEINDLNYIKKNILLAIAWNCPGVVKLEKLSKNIHYEIDNDTFFEALVTLERGEFVTLFLSHGFKVHKFLNSNTLLLLYQSSLRREFFRTVVWENILGYGHNIELSRDFIDNKLSVLFQNLTSIPDLVNSHEMDKFFNGVYEKCSPEEAERKAILNLILWAVLSYRMHLVKSIWQYSEQPIHSAIICSVILLKLKSRVVDLSLNQKMSDHSEEFSKMATELMTECHNSVSCRAIDLLCEENHVWSYKSLIEIAAFAKSTYFISHPSCQKYLDYTFMGNMKIVDLPFGDLTLPPWLKIILSIFLIFPMYLFISFKPSKFEDSYHPRFHSHFHHSSSNKNSNGITFWKKIYYLYTAPVSKFWITQVFYFVYLLIFSLAVLWPACGNSYLDFIVCLWISIIVVDFIYQILSLRKMYPSISMKYRIVDVAVMTVFLICYMTNRLILPHCFLSPYGTKVMLGVTLLYSYYRIIFLAFPISSELGTLLYGIKRMVIVDFIGFMRFTSLVMISNGIVLHAIIYPDYPLNWELCRRLIFEVLITFFLSPADNFGMTEPHCIKLKRHPNRLSFIGLPENTCKVGRYFSPECSNPGVWPYIFGLQFFIIFKIILFTLLYVLFRYTKIKLDLEGTNIWKYQRYELIMDFQNRPVFPAPLSPLCYVGQIVCRICDIVCRQKKQVRTLELNESDFKFWKRLAKEYYNKKLKENNGKCSIGKRKKDVLMLKTKLNGQKKALYSLRGYLTELQIQIRESRKYLIRSTLKVSLKEQLKVKHVSQLFSRTSPYPGTNILRFPVPDNYVSWSKQWTFYDPIAYTLPKEDYHPMDLRSYVDVDIQLERKVEGDNFKMPHFKWNTCTISPGGVFVDRQSWILDKLDKPLIYKLNTENLLPINPLGRTGLRGRGCLPRWGPNHCVFAIISKWQETKFEPLHKYLEIVSVINGNGLTLPGGYVFHEHLYKVISSIFDKDVSCSSEKEMIDFFYSFASKHELNIDPTLPSTSNDKSEIQLDEDFVFQLIARGYFDEATNTDQAWCEAEIWHFHYNVECNIDQKFKPDTIWVLLTEDILKKVPIGQAAFLYRFAKKMKAATEVI